jgi:hypothetical protein
MDIRMHLKVIINYKEVYGEAKAITDFADLIRDIPSITFLIFQDLI